MFKKILFVAALLLAATAQAQQPPFVRNDSNTTVLNGVNGRQASAAVNDKGQVSVGSVVHGTGATNLGKAQGGTYTAGDTGVAPMGVRNTSFATLTGAQGTYGPIGITAQGSVYSTIDHNFQPSPAAGILKLEDSSATTGDAGVSVLGYTNSNAVTLAAGEGDYINFAANNKGAIFPDINSDFQQSAGKGLLKLEDSGVASGDSGVFVLAVAETALTGTVGASNEYGAMKTDGVGRLITAPAVPGETWQACSGVAAGIVDVAIKAAVASNRMYVTSLTCYNNSTTATTIDIDDGATSIWKAYLGTTTLGNNQYSQTFPVPLRGSVNTALNVKPSTTSSGTFCCAAGYISVS